MGLGLISKKLCAFSYAATTSGTTSICRINLGRTRHNIILPGRSLGALIERITKKIYGRSLGALIERIAKKI
jgi:hypothetical protein